MTESGPREGLPLQASQMPRQGRHGLVGLLLEPGLGSTTILRFLPCCLALASVAARPGSRSAELHVPATETATRVNATLNPIASLITVPIRNNFDRVAGRVGDGFH